MQYPGHCRLTLRRVPVLRMPLESKRGIAQAGFSVLPNVTFRRDPNLDVVGGPVLEKRRRGNRRAVWSGATIAHRGHIDLVLKVPLGNDLRGFDEIGTVGVYRPERVCAQ